MKKVYAVVIISVFSLTYSYAQTWSELGGAKGLNAQNDVEATCVDASGNVYAAGNFKNGSGNYYVAKWNGTSWSETGGPNALGADNYIYSLCADPFGNIYAAGVFRNVAGHMYVAKWDGSNWYEVGGLDALSGIANVLNAEIVCLYCDAAGNLYAGGQFTNQAGNEFVAKWDGTQWSELGGYNSLAANDFIASICSDSLGNIYAAGAFTDDSGFSYVAKTNGTGWSQLGDIGGLNGYGSNTNIFSICNDRSGNIYATGIFADSSARYYVAKWNGINWTEIGGRPGLSANNGVNCVAADAAGNIYAAGNFTNHSNNRYVAKWDGASWSELGGVNALAANSFIFTMTRDQHDNIYVGGSFTDDSSTFYVARYGTAVATSTFADKITSTKIQLFPNPATGVVNLVSENELNAVLSLYDINGKILLSNKIQGVKTGELDISSLAAGMYLLQVKPVDGTMQTIKLIKE